VRSLKKLAIERKANWTLVDAGGRTPLAVAIEWQKQEIVDIFHQHGINK